MHGRCLTAAPTAARELFGAGAGLAQCPPTRRKRLARAPHNRKRPAGEAGRFWGYYREERYVSLYMCGSVGGRWALDVPRAPHRWESMSAIWGGAEPNQEVFVLPFIVLSCRSLNQSTN